MTNKKQAVEVLRRELRIFRVNTQVDFNGMLQGDPEPFVQLYRYLFCDHSAEVSSFLVENNYHMNGTKENRFIEVMYRVCRDVLNFKPILSISQFFTKSFPEKKIQIAVDIIKALAGLHKELQRLKPALRKCSLMQNKLTYCRIFPNVPATTHIVQGLQTETVTVKAPMLNGIARASDNVFPTSRYNFKVSRSDKTRHFNIQQPQGLNSENEMKFDTVEVKMSNVPTPQQLKLSHQLAAREPKFQMDLQKFMLPPKIDVNPISMATEDESLQSITLADSTKAQLSEIQAHNENIKTTTEYKMLAASRERKHLYSFNLETMADDKQCLPVTQKLPQHNNLRQHQESIMPTSPSSCLLPVMTSEQTSEATPLVATRTEVDLWFANRQKPAASYPEWEDSKSLTQTSPLLTCQFSHDDQTVSISTNLDSMPRIAKERLPEFTFLPHLDMVLQKISSQLATLIGRVQGIESRVTAIEMASLSRDKLVETCQSRQTPESVTTSGHNHDSVMPQQNQPCDTVERCKTVEPLSSESNVKHHSHGANIVAGKYEEDNNKLKLSKHMKSPDPTCNESPDLATYPNCTMHTGDANVRTSRQPQSVVWALRQSSQVRQSFLEKQSQLYRSQSLSGDSLSSSFTNKCFAESCQERIPLQIWSPDRSITSGDHHEIPPHMNERTASPAYKLQDISRYPEALSSNTNHFLKKPKPVIYNRSSCTIFPKQHGLVGMQAFKLREDALTGNTSNLEISKSSSSSDKENRILNVNTIKRLCHKRKSAEPDRFKSQVDRISSMLTATLNILEKPSPLQENVNAIRGLPNSPRGPTAFS